MKGKLSPNRRITELPGATVGDFWSWAYSNIRDNTVRSIFAEWLVGTLLGVESEGRVEWDSYDLEFDGTKIEVKSAAYVQAWSQEKPSSIRFDIAEKLAWDAKSNTYAAAPTRAADVYVFALHDDQDMETADPLDIHRWRFWIMTTAEVYEAFGTQKGVALSRVRANGHEVDSSSLSQALRELCG